MIRSYTTWYATCPTCDWKGPMRYSEFQAQEDLEAHQELRGEHDGN